MTEPGSLLTEPGVVIKFSHFSSHPGTCMIIRYILFTNELEKVDACLVVMVMVWGVVAEVDVWMRNMKHCRQTIYTNILLIGEGAKVRQVKMKNMHIPWCLMHDCTSDIRATH